MKSSQVMMIMIIIVFSFFIFTFLLKMPPVWPDEPIYTDAAINILKNGHLSSNLWRFSVPYAENHIFWYPPLFFYLIAIWLKIFGFSIINQRVFSVFCGYIFIIIYYFFARRVFKNKSEWFAILAIIGLIFDFVFLKAVRISRPEMFLLFIGTVSLYLFDLALNSSSNRGKNYLMVASGFTASLAVLTHTIGSMFFITIFLYFVFIKGKEVIKTNFFYYFLLAFTIPLLIWFVSIIPHINEAKEQLVLNFIRKNMEEPWLWQVFREQPIEVKLIYLGYIIMTLVSLIVFILNKNRQSFLISIILILSWFFSTYGRMIWYFALIVPFVYLSFTYTLSEIKDKTFRWILVIILFLMIALNLNLHKIFLIELTDNAYSYKTFTDSVLKFIPDRATVFLSSIPDPYYGFIEGKRNNILYEFPVLPTKIDNFLKVLNDSDYIVFTRIYNSIVFGDYLQRYIDKNTSQLYPIGNFDQYTANVIKLKPRNQRLQP